MAFMRPLLSRALKQMPGTGSFSGREGVQRAGRAAILAEAGGPIGELVRYQAEQRPEQVGGDPKKGDILLPDSWASRVGHSSSFEKEVKGT